MKAKPILCPERLRRVPRQFSWIDQRLVRDGHISRCGANALALYLLLCTVADAQGLSYYSDAASRLAALPFGVRTARGSRRAAFCRAHRLSGSVLPGLEPGTPLGPMTQPPAPRTGRSGSSMADSPAPDEARRTKS